VALEQVQSNSEDRSAGIICSESGATTPLQKVAIDSLLAIGFVAAVFQPLAMDVLDQLLADLRPESCVFCRLDATEPWRIQKSSITVAPLYAALSGKARIETANNAYDLREGEFLVLPGGEPHELTGADFASAPPVPLLSLLAEAGAEPWKPGMRYRRTVHPSSVEATGCKRYLSWVVLLPDIRLNHGCVLVDGSAIESCMFRILQRPSLFRHIAIPWPERCSAGVSSV
jgi:hypothetical protein